MDIVVFDIGGTLVEYRGMPLSWVGLYKDAFGNVGRRLGLALTEADIERSCEVMTEYNPRVNPREEDIAPEVIFADATAHWRGSFELSEVIDVFFGSMKIETYLYPETKDVLDRLRAKGYRIAAFTDVASAMPDELHKSFFPELMPYFDMYVSSLGCGRRKPSPKGLSDIAERFGVRACDMLMIGDEPKDIETARRFGCRAVLIDRDGSGADCGQDFTIRDLNGLWEVLRQEIN